MLSESTVERTRRDLAREMLTGADAFGVVLVLILLTILVFAGADGSAGQLVSVVLSGGTLLFVLHTAGTRGRPFRAAAALVTAALVFTAGTLLLGDTIGSSTARAVGLLLAFVAPVVILRRIITSPRITFRLVLGALAIYLLFGLAYSYLFPFIASATGKPFFVQTTTPTAADYLYFSYTTLATIGYGDYTAQQSLGRMVAVSEGLLGQLYLVSAVAVLVGNVGRDRLVPGNAGGSVAPGRVGEPEDAAAPAVTRSPEP
jgi:ion channel